jgi:hypothetical protein
LDKNVIEYDKPYYLLLKEIRDICHIDPRWNLIDTIPERTFFESNSLLYLE